VNVLRGSYGVFRESKREEDPSNCWGCFKLTAGNRYGVGFAQVFKKIQMRAGTGMVQ
jgi:hypothetical protein